MKLSFFPFDFSHKVEVNGEGENTLLVMYGKTAKGEKVTVSYPFAPYFYCEKKDPIRSKIENLHIAGKDAGFDAKVCLVEEVTRNLIGVDGHYFKVTVNVPKAVVILAREIESWGVTCYEKDILYVHRAIRDMGILACSRLDAVVEKNVVDSKGSNETTCGRDMYIATSVSVVTKDEVCSDFSILAVDIETYAVSKEIDATKNPILMIGLYGATSAGVKGKEKKAYERVLTWKKCSGMPSYAEVFADEKEMLVALNLAVSEFGPDILTGYYSDGFDFPYIKTRADKLGVKLSWGVDGSELFLSKRGSLRDSESSIVGIVHLDVCAFVKNIFGKNLKTESFSLDAVASELLSEKKLDVSLDALSPAWDAGSKDLARFMEYNLQDARLTWRLCERLLLDMIEFARVIGVPLFDVIRMKFSRLVESFILNRAAGAGILAPNKPSDEETGDRMDDAVQGAFVFEPIPGLYKDIAVFDFRSLYPSIITAHNISPESLQCDHSECKKKVVPGREKYWFCLKKKAFLPSILEDIINKRSEIKAKLKKHKAQDEVRVMLESRSYAFKILANSFYGYLGFYAARWYCIECSDSTTAYARYYIGDTIEVASREGFKVIYADTDSCFMERGAKSKEDATLFMKKINAHLPGLMELELEGYYPRGIFVGAKGAEKKMEKNVEVGGGDEKITPKGAKKRYALLSEDGKMKITGFEVVRRNAIELAREVQEEVLRRVLSDDVVGAVAYAQKMVADLKLGKIPLSKLVMKTQLTRELGKYSSIGPHVRVATMMKERGERVYSGMTVAYVILKGKGLVRDRAVEPKDAVKGEYDIDYYMDHHLIPCVSSILLVFGYSEDQIALRSEQKGLNKFF